jgi:NitT/TauT family transport system permease protein
MNVYFSTLAERLFELRGNLTKRENNYLLYLGIFLILLLWQAITSLTNVPSGVFPSPIKVLKCFPELHFQDAVVRNALYSLYLNQAGMFLAVIASLPLGFIIGLFPLFRGLTERQIAVFRYLPLTLLIGAFIRWFGLEDMMKITFLAVGIFVYLLPTVIIRVDEVKEVYIQTVKTLGASKWQIIKTVFIPDVLSRAFDDIKVLAPISWTYIIIAEMINKTGGLGAMAYLFGRQSRADKAFAILVIIILIGIFLDRIFTWLDKLFFPHKYVTKGSKK